METPSLNIVDSSFEHVLHSYGLHLVSTYKYEIGNCLFDFISYLLDKNLSFIEFLKNGTFKSMFIIAYRKTQQCHVRELNPSFLFDLHQGMVINKH